jgi:hypothetical protein
MAKRLKVTVTVEDDILDRLRDCTARQSSEFALLRRPVRERCHQRNHNAAEAARAKEGLDTASSRSRPSS